MLAEAVEAVPGAGSGWVEVWVDEVEVFEEVVAAAVIAGGAGEDHVFEGALAAAGVGDDVVILRPEALEGGVLGGV